MNKKPTYEDLKQRVRELEKAQSGHRKAQEELSAHVYLLENLNKIDKIIRGGTDAEKVMGKVLETLLDIFGCDRAWLLYPCDPDAPFWSVPLERTRDEFPGAFDKDVKLPMTADAALAMKSVLETSEPIFGTLDPGEPEYDLENQFDILAYIITAVHPKIGKPWEFGLHQCSHQRQWTDQEISLFKKISNRIEDTLSVLLILRDLKESESKYRSILESMDEGAYICSPDFQIKYMNPAMIKLVGCDATGEVCYKAIHHLEQPCEWCEHKNVMNGQRVKAEVVKSDNNKTYFISHSPIYHGGSIVSKLGIYRDITDVKIMEARLLQSQKMEAIGTLAGGIAHDFNNILSGIFGFSQLAQNHINNPDRALADIDNVLKGAKKAAELVQQILTVSRKSTHVIQPLSVFLVVKESLKLLRASIPSTIRIKENIASNATIMADPTKIHQVIMNLCTNAYHAMLESGGILSVDLENVNIHAKDKVTGADIEPGEYVKLKVGDTGHGMESGLTKKIFEPYFTTKEPDKGTGLGLAVVFGIVQEYKGHINVYSEPGRGTTFHVYLPRVDKTAATYSRKKEAVPVSGSESILLVDDEIGLLTSVKKLLEGLGYTVTAHLSGAKAFETYQQRHQDFDIVITDMTMPEMTGMDLSRKILELRPEQPIIICTGHNEQINREKAIASGISEYYEKPVIIHTLAKLIRTVLNRK